MVLQSSSTISQSQIYADSSQNNLIIDTSGTIQNVGTYTSGSINLYPITSQLNTGIVPPTGEYAILFSVGTTSGNYISITSAVTALNISWATGTVYSTVECWIYLTGYNSSGSIIFGKCTPTAATLDWQFNVTSTGYLQLIYNTAANGTQTVTSTLQVPLNSWCHVALVFTPATPTNTWFLCLNGAVFTSTLVGTLTTNSSTNLFTIGQYNSTMTHIGYISCLRVMSSSTIATALYRSSYSTPIYPLTKVTGTVLILRGNGKHLVDVSGIITNLYSSTINYNVTYISTPSLYGSLSAIDRTPIVGANNTISSTPPFPDGALYFNGTVGTYITNTNAAYQYNWTSGITIEFWANFQAFPQGVTGTVQPTLIGNQSATSTTSPWWSFGPNSSGQLLFWYVATPTNVFITTTNSLLINTWYHIAFTCNGTNFYIFVNGKLFYTTAIVQTPTTITTGVLTLGQYNNLNPMNCFISNLRIVKTALYTSDFNLVSDILSTNTSCIMLLRATQYMLDISKNVNTVSISGANVNVGGICGTKNTIYTGTLPPGGDGVVYLPNISAAGNYLTSNAAAFYFNWWSTRFTCELWVNYQSFANSSQVSASPAYNSPSLIGMMYATSSTNYWSFGANPNGTLSFYYWNGAQVSLTTTQTLSLNTWYHIAVTYNLSLIRILINGAQAASAALSGTPQMGTSANVNFTIGQYNTSYYANAFVSNVRLINGSALYTGTYAVPTQPLGISETGTTVFLLRVPPIEAPLSQTSLTKTYVNRYRPNVNVSQGPPPGAIVGVDVNSISIGYTTPSPPIFDKQTRNGITFNGTSNYLALNSIQFSPFSNFTFVATFSYLSSITPGAHLFIIGDTVNFLNYLSITYTATNTLSFFRCANGVTNVITATVYPNIVNSVVYTYNIGGNPPAISIYVNNALISTTTVSPLTVPLVNRFTGNFIGGLTNSSYAPFTCNNFAIYNRNFGANDVASYYSIIASGVQQVIPSNPLIDLALSLNEIIQINASSVVITTISTTSLSVYFTGTFSTATLYYYGPDGKSGTSTNVTSGSTTTISSLTINTQYTIVIIPYNSAGISSYYGTYTGTGSTLPNVTGFYALVSSLTSVTLYWAGNGFGSNYSYLTVGVSPSISGAPFTIQAGVPFYLVTDLAISTSYTFTLTPYNANGIAGTAVTYTITGAATSPTYITPFFNGFTFMLVDNASGNYVSFNADSSSKYLTNSTSSINATLFKVYNNAAVYNNGSGGVALQTYGGTGSDGNYLRHSGLICYSNGFASNNFDYAWRFDATSTQNVYTIYNWYGGNYYLDIVSNYLQITSGSSRQWRVIAYDYNAIQSCGLFTSTYNLHQWYAYQSIFGTTWIDMSGNGRNGSSSAAPTAASDLINTYTIPYYYGSTGLTVTFGAIPSPYTVFTVTRYNSATGTTYRRIITATNENSLQGHWNGYAGSIYHNAWIFPNNSPNTTYVSPNTSWTFTTSTVSGNRIIVQGSTQNSGLTSAAAVGGSTGSVTGNPGSFTINGSTVNLNETSDWAFTEFGVWNREINAYEMSIVNSYIFRKYGIGAAPALHIGSVGYLVFSHKITLNSGIYFANAAEADNTGSLSLVTSQAQHKYSILSQIGNFRRSNGTYEFLFYICTDDTNFTTMPYRRWTQTSNPYTTAGSATGYTAITQGWNIPDPVGGLRQSGSPGLTRYDIEASGTNWWGAIGQYSAYNGGFPQDNTARTFIQLWMV